MKKTEIIMIAAMAGNRVIGCDNCIPWHIPGEQLRFKRVTMGHPLIMGRKTWQDLGRPLPGRRNIVLTRNPSFVAAGADVVNSQAEALSLCEGVEKVFIIGGEEIYKLFLPLADTIILTILPLEVKGDSWFPDFSGHGFVMEHKVDVDGEIPYQVETYRRTLEDI